MDYWSDGGDSYFVLRPRAWKIKEPVCLEIKLRHKPRNKNTNLKACKSIMSSQKRN